MNYSDEKVYKILVECNAIKEGHFILASGNHSSHYVQCAMLMQYPAKLVQVILEKLPLLPQNINTVFVPAVGGVPLGVELAHCLNCRSIFAERDENNKMILKRSFEIYPDENILIAEDVMTTGSTVKELIELVKANNANVIGIYTLINRMGKKEFEGFNVFASLEIDLPIYKKEECPLCAKGIPAVRPGTKKVSQ
ncbi:MAG TPA: orotate phosphoribosyltransferase [bacterium]|nr:orotate phosphoribosyltransferase [bacterium]HOL48013.1 orotate phosphoribosyltransferase [bacterium]HPQ19315.1 orotate phosphoribosyltransferase [bacterium]